VLAAGVDAHAGRDLTVVTIDERQPAGDAKRTAWTSETGAWGDPVKAQGRTQKAEVRNALAVASFLRLKNLRMLAGVSSCRTCAFCLVPSALTTYQFRAGSGVT
jgi:hypothetical protein